jgi:hypothetical protein
MIMETLTLKLSSQQWGRLTELAAMEKTSVENVAQKLIESCTEAAESGNACVEKLVDALVKTSKLVLDSMKNESA